MEICHSYLQWFFFFMTFHGEIEYINFYLDTNFDTNAGSELVLFYIDICRFVAISFAYLRRKSCHIAYR